MYRYRRCAPDDDTYKLYGGEEEKKLINDCFCGFTACSRVSVKCEMHMARVYYRLSFSTLVPGMCYTPIYTYIRFPDRWVGFRTPRAHVLVDRRPQCLCANTPKHDAYNVVPTRVHPPVLCAKRLQLCVGKNFKGKTVRL